MALAADPRRRYGPGLLAGVLFAAGLSLAVSPGGEVASAPTVRAAAAPAERPASGGVAPEGLPRAVPVHLDIPAIGIHAPVTQLGLDPDGTIAMPPPTRTAPAGWYRGLASPGEIGTAVIVGHVDSARFGPAVFYRLRQAERGDAVTVRRADGTTARFTVVAIRTYAKKHFPAAAVYGMADRAELRLITCGGAFDRRRGHYRDVVVVYAVA